MAAGLLAMQFVAKLLLLKVKSPGDGCGTRAQTEPQPMVPPEYGSASLATIEGEKGIVTRPMRPIGHTACMGLAVNRESTVLPELPKTRSVLEVVIVTRPPLALVVGLFAPVAPPVKARMPTQISQKKRGTNEQ